MVQGGDNLREEFLALQKRVDELSTRSNTTNSHNTMSHNNTININAFGCEDVSGITGEVLDRCIRRTNVGLVDLIKTIHFDRAANRNVKANISHPEIVECHDGRDWVYDQKKCVLQKMVDSGHRMMSNHFDDNTDRYKTEMSRALFRYVYEWLDKMEKSNHAVYADVMEKVFVLILNHSRYVSDMMDAVSSPSPAGASSSSSTTPP